jgi:hypothetical protein
MMISNTTGYSNASQIYKHEISDRVDYLSRVYGGIVVLRALLVSRGF